MSEFEFVRFEKAKAKGKKYAAILKNKQTGRKKTVNFGSADYGQFKDSTGLGLWSYKDHNNEKRRKSYHARHSAIPSYNIRYTPAWFSRKYLW